MLPSSNVSKKGEYAGEHDHRLIDVKQLSIKLGVSPHTIYQWLSQKRFPFPIVTIGRLVRFDIKDVDSWIDRNKNTLGDAPHGVS